MAALRGLDTTVELTRHAVALRSQGYDFAMRYYSNNASKNLSLGEARALSQAGLRIGVVWETSGTHAAFFTRAQGLADGAQAYRMARESIGQPFGSAIYFAVDYDPTQADIDGGISNYFTGVHAALYVANDGAPSYRVGVYGSGLCCGALVERDIAALSWLSQSTGFAGSRQYAEQKRYDILQMLPARIVGADGIVLGIDPDTTHPDRDAGLFSV
ncbi:DUF1906 domain-containing protein [Massilia norwichensis]|uniref:DUF1906 domain-containing protein n=1 Tax=Massilia norwichensis TaxID=1442366 RepID=A0ABT2AE67_9BURK|nr:DUF1906 domain-containing protein [Massilia norwichensis]MCS0592469.1 DUF1906 domain-containing protein [Massilia norwichensis]